MHLIVGLGNPGGEHAGNRHNIGFMAVDAIAARHALPPFRQKFQGLITDGAIDGQRVLLLKPQTYMNLSGNSVAAAAAFYKLGPEAITVIYDELDLEPGKVRIKRGGGNGGHNGLRSIDPVIGKDYRRIRLGIGHPGSKERVTGHVLSDFHKLDHDWLDPLLNTLADNAGLIVSGDEANLMNRLALATAPVRDPERPAARGVSHVRQARPQAPTAKLPEKGPMADMLRKLLGR